MSEKVFTTACPRNCYSTCGLSVTVKDGKITTIEGHKGSKATLEGPCLKGLSYIERVNSPDRLMHPLKRSGDEFVQISWEEALDTIAEKLKDAKDMFGTKSIFYYSASGTKGIMNGIGAKFWKLFGGYTTTYGDLCWPAGLEATRLMFGGNDNSVPWDIENSKLIILWGKNAAETNIHQMVHINNAIKNGAKLVVIDPRRTQTAERADLFIQPEPGTDGALALGIANLLIQNEKIDEDFIKNNVLGFEEYRKHVEDTSVEKVSKIANVPVEDIIKLVKMIGDAEKVSITCGFGMQRYTNSGQSLRAIIALLAITGNIGKSGAGWYFANLQSHIFDEVKDPVASFPPETDNNTDVRVSISTAKLGEEMLATIDPELKFGWVERGNPIPQNPDTNQVLEAFRKLDFLVVVDQFLTDTAREADIVLPAKSMFEQSDIITAYWHPYIQLKQKLIDLPGEVLAESEIYYFLAQKLDIPIDIVKRTIPEPNEESVEKYLAAHIQSFPELTLDKLKMGPIIAPGNKEIAWEDLKFTTPSGKIELYSQTARSLWGLKELPEWTAPVESVGEREVKYELYLMTPNTKNRIHSQFGNLEMIKEVSPEPEISISFTDAEKRKIKNGDMVRVYNDRGELLIICKIDFSIKDGCVSITNGWWIEQGAAVNFLSKGRETDMGYGAAFHDNLVEVEKAD